MVLWYQEQTDGAFSYIFMQSWQINSICTFPEAELLWRLKLLCLKSRNCLPHLQRRQEQNNTTKSTRRSKQKLMALLSERMQSLHWNDLKWSEMRKPGVSDIFFGDVFRCEQQSMQSPLWQKARPKDGLLGLRQRIAITAISPSQTSQTSQISKKTKDTKRYEKHEQYEDIRRYSVNNNTLSRLPLLHLHNQE